MGIRAAIIVSTLAALAAPARADRDRESDRDDAATASASRDNQIAIVNAMAELGDAGQVTRVRRALAARGLLVKLPGQIEAALEGRTQLTVDIEPIKQAYADFEYDRAGKLIDDQEDRILSDAIAGDPTTALAELTLWRGLLAAAQDKPEDAIRWFRGAYRLNSALTIDKRFASPSVRQLVKQARREAEDTGVLRIDPDPEVVDVSIDGGPRSELPPSGKLELESGLHLVVISAPRRAPYAEMIEIRAGKTERLEISLPKENEAHRAARLVDQTAAAPPGKARLKRAGALSKITGTKRILVIEDGSDDSVTVRVYDVDHNRVSKPLSLSGTASSASIARIVQAALDSDENDLERKSSKRWYERWYVWAAVGAVAIGSYAGYEYMTREPTTIRGF